MVRSLLLASIVVALAGCAAAPPRVAIAKPPVSDEVECLVDCLADGSEECQGCADRCLDPRDELDVVAASRELAIPPGAFARLPR